MNLDFEKKQILRSMSNLLVNRPVLMKAALSIDHEARDDFFKQLEPVFNMVRVTPYDETNESIKEAYFRDLNTAILEIGDKEIKSFILETTKSLTATYG